MDTKASDSLGATGSGAGEFTGAEADEVETVRFTMDVSATCVAVSFTFGSGLSVSTSVADFSLSVDDGSVLESVLSALGVDFGSSSSSFFFDEADVDADDVEPEAEVELEFVDDVSDEFD